jgi:hypothetical protein
MCNMSVEWYTHNTHASTYLHCNIFTLKDKKLCFVRYGLVAIINFILKVLLRLVAMINSVFSIYFYRKTLKSECVNANEF